jgi:hypothetical protein
MSTAYSFQLAFNSNVGEKLYITIPRADGTLTENAVRANMNALIANGGVMTDKGYPTSVVGASRTKKEVEEIEF